ncbi:DUF488 domain-containing protein [Treponema denticola]|uniref:DUF488 domain-containing protein n=1 Tax=Treponema denticola TaxID=158 RepID=UPI0021031128|nr:DUF488 domain-containing protein [Treponema denticola]UTY23688.1 DUF488 domain-containing protein [Treponema denticola]
MKTLYSIGYSSYNIEVFINILKSMHIDAIVDVRSSPYSRYKPEYNKETLKQKLLDNNIYYVFLGSELGARSEDDTCYIGDRADYSRISKTDNFKKGVNRLINGLEKYTIALMCAEIDPLRCHRNILVCRSIRKYNVNISHILDNGRIETNDSAETRLVSEYSMNKNDMFMTEEEVIESAYDRRSLEIAYKRSNNDNEYEG